jgi:hypothetical protein
MRHTLLMHDIPQGIGIGGIYRPRHQQPSSASTALPGRFSPSWNDAFARGKTA